MRITTERLLLRPFTKDDVDDLYEYLHTPEVNCFMDMAVVDYAAAKKAVEERMKDKEYTFAIELEGKVIGEIFSGPENNDTFSPCWMLNKKYQGQGYMYEAAYAYFDYLFSHGARRIYAYTEDDNIPCQKLLRRLGMREEGLFKEFISFVNHPDGTPKYENTYQFALLKWEWDNIVSEK